MPVIEKERETLSTELLTAVRHSAVYGLGNVAVKVLGFFMLPFYTHYLAPKDYGVLEILDLSMSMIGMLLNMGITAAFLRCYTTAAAADEKRRVVSTAYLFVAATGAVTLLGGLPLVGLASALLLGADVPSTYLLLSFIGFIVNYVANLPRTYLRALEASGMFVLVDTGGLFLTLILNIVLIAGFQMGLSGILWSSVLVGGVQSLVLSIWALHKAGIGFSVPLLRRMMAFGLPLVFANLAMFTLNFADRFFLQHLRSLEVVGIYAIAYKFGYMINFLLLQPFNTMWYTRMYIIHGRPDHAKVFSQVFLFYSLLLTYTALGLALLSPEIVNVMVDSKFAASEAVIPVIALSYVVCGAAYYVQLGMLLSNRTELIGILSAGAAIFNLGLNYVLITYFGMMGAATATALSFLAMAIGSYWLSQRSFPLPLPVARVATALLVAIAFYFVSRLWEPRSLAITVFVKAAVLVGFPVLLWRARICSEEEIGTLVSAGQTVVAKLSRLVGGASTREECV
jgi:O-antigen/teichoic acid export membrane protein